MNEDLDDFIDALDDDSEEFLDEDIREKLFNISARQKIDIMMEERKMLEEMGEDLW